MCENAQLMGEGSRTRFGNYFKKLRFCGNSGVQKIRSVFTNKTPAFLYFWALMRYCMKTGNYSQNYMPISNGFNICILSTKMIFAVLQENKRHIWNYLIFGGDLNHLWRKFKKLAVLSPFLVIFECADICKYTWKMQDWFVC